MRSDKEKIIEFRRQGKSYNEITNKFSVSKSTLTAWFQNLNWSRDLAISLAKKAEANSSIRIQALNKVRGEHLKRLYIEAKSEALEEFNYLQHHPLFITGVVIYWGEGDKASKNGFRISNSDPAMIRLYLVFLLRICRVNPRRIRASLLLYPDLNEKICKEYWIKNTGLTEKDFTKTIFIEGKHKSKKLIYGVCIVNYSSTYLKEKMRVWIDLLSKSFM